MNKKIINLFEFERPVTQSQFFPFAASVWGMNPSGLYSDTLYDIMQPERINDVVFFSLYNIKLVFAFDNIVILTKKTTYADVVSTPSSWYFDNTTLFVHFPDSNTPYSYSDGQIVIGAYQGYYTSTQDKELSLLGGLYEPRLISFPLYRSQLDNFATGEQASAGGQVVLDNSDGALDNFSFGRDPETLEEVLPKIGWYGRIRQAILDIGSTALDSDFKVIAQGFTTKITEQVSAGKGFGVEIELKDIRASLDKDIQLIQLSATTYTKLSAKDLENPPLAPIIFGKVSKLPVICLNPVQPTIGADSNYKYLIGCADDLTYTSIDKIYIQNAEITATATIQTETQSTGETIAYFELPRTQFIKMTSPTPTFDYVGFEDVSVDITGSAITNGLDIVAKLLELTYGETYDTEYFDTTQWAVIQAIAPDCGIVIDKPTQLKSIIEEVQKAIPLTQFTVDENQKYSWIDFSWSDSGIIFTLQPDAFPQGYIPSPDVNSETIAGKVQVNYDYRHSLQSWARVSDTSNLETALTKFNTDRTYPEEYSTIISNKADADVCMARLTERFFYPDARLSFDIPMQYRSGTLYAYELKAGDKVKILANTFDRQLYGYLGCIIEEINQDLEGLKIALTLRIIYTSSYNYKQPIYIVDNEGNYLGDGSFYYGGIK